VGMFRFFHVSMHIHYSTVPPCVLAASVTAKHDWFHFHTDRICPSLFPNETQIYLISLYQQRTLQPDLLRTLIIA
jgi:hypothetical protein